MPQEKCAAGKLLSPYGTIEKASERSTTHLDQRNWFQLLNPRRRGFISAVIKSDPSSKCGSDCVVLARALRRRPRASAIRGSEVLEYFIDKRVVTESATFDLAIKSFKWISKC